MNGKQSTPLQTVISDKTVVEALRQLWIISVEEAMSLYAAIQSSREVLQAAESLRPALLRAAAVAQGALPKERLDTVASPRPGGRLGCRLDPQVLEDFRLYGRLRPAEVRPTGAFEDRLPSSVRLTGRMPPVKDQGQRGTCVAFGTVALREFLLDEYVGLSEQFLYWACKQLDGSPGPGTYLHTAMTALAEYGVCRASVWPYNPVQMEDEGQGPPLAEAISDAKRCILSSTRTVEPGLVIHYKHVLAGSHGSSPMPVSFATLVFESWYMSPETHRTGKITMPLPGEQPAGGHAWCVVGYVDDPEVPGGGYFIVRNSWGEGWASDSPEASGHALMPYAYVERYAVEAFTGPAVPAAKPRELDSEWRDFIRILDRDERDMDGRLVKSGTAVLCHPSQPQVFRVDTPADRQEFLRRDRTWTPEARQRSWFPPLSSLPPDFAARAGAWRVARKAFLASIDENVTSAVGQRVPEVTTLPVWSKLLAWEPRIRQATEAADLSEALAEQMAQGDGVPPEVTWTKEWQQQLADLNVVKVYALRGMTATIHVVAAFVTPVRFHAGGIPELLPPDQSTADSVQTIFDKWRQAQGRQSSAFVCFTVGSGLPWAQQVTGQAAGDHWFIVSGQNGDGLWETRTPPQDANGPALASFLDRLWPVTQQQRIHRIKEFVDELLKSGYEGHIHREKIAEETGYRPTTVRDALFALRDSGHYRLYATSDDILAVTSQTAAIGIRAPQRGGGHGWLLRLACLSPAIGVTLWLAKDAIMGQPCEFQNLIALLPLAYAGEWLNTRLGKWREDKE